MISNIELLDMVFKDGLNVAVFDKTKNLSNDINYVFTFLCDLLKYDYADKRKVIEFIPGQHYYLKMREDKKFVNHVVRFGGIKNKPYIDKNGEEANKLVLELLCAPDYVIQNAYVLNDDCKRFENLRALDYIWRLTPANGIQLTPGVKLTSSVTDETPVLKLAEKCGVEITEISRIKRTNVIWIPSRPIDELINSLRDFYIDGYNFLEYFSTQQWSPQDNFRMIATTRYARQETEWCILSIFKSLYDYNCYLNSVGVKENENYIVITDGYKSLFDGFNLAQFKGYLTLFHEQLHLIYFGDISSAEKILKILDGLPPSSIEEVYPFKFVFPNFDRKQPTEILKNTFNVGHPLPQMMEELLNLKMTVVNDLLRNKIKILIGNLNLTLPKNDLLESILEMLQECVGGYGIEQNLLNYIGMFKASDNLKLASIKELLENEDSCLIYSEKLENFDRVVKLGEFGGKILDGSLKLSDNFIIPEVFPPTFQKITPLILMGYIRTNQIFPVLYENEIKYLTNILRRIQKLLVVTGVLQEDVQYSTQLIQNEQEGNDFPKVYDLYFPEITTDAIRNNNLYERCSILYLWNGGKELFLPISSGSKRLYTLCDGDITQKSLDDIEVGDEIIYFYGNQNIKNEFEEFKNVINFEMVGKAEEWKKILKEYYSSGKFNIQKFTDELNSKGLKVGVPAVKGWISEERIGTMNPMKDFPIIAEVIGDRELLNRISEFAFACRYLQSKSKQLGRWLIKTSRSLLLGESIDNLLAGFDSDFRKKIESLSKKYQILTVVDISSSEHLVETSKVNILKEI